MRVLEAALDQMDMLGRVRIGLAPRYEVLDQIGQGGSSVVYKAQDTRHDRTVAIKVLTPDRWSGVRPTRFKREIRIASKLQHPNILPLFDSGHLDGLPYYTMPFVDGESLRDLIRRKGQLDIGTAVGIVGDVAEALQHAHSQDVFHRDIKPGNNILLRDGQAVVADFGIAIALDHAADTYETSTGHAPGTPFYMSPEHAGDSKVDARSDVYSLGCVLYETLVGEPPFTGPTVQAVIAKHMVEPPPSARVVRPGVPPVIAEVIQKALSKTPADRFQTAAHFATALQKGATVSVDSWRRRRALRVTARYAALLLVVGAATIWGIRVLRSPPPSPNRVVVFPLVQTGAPDGSEGGWDVALAVEMALEHTEPLRWIDGWSRLPADLRSDPSRVTHELARTIALDQGAARYVDGVIRAAGDSTALTLRLHNALTGEVLAQETAWGAGEPLHQLGLAAVVPLLSQLIEPGRSVDLTPLTDRTPAAVALSIQGDRAYRQSRFGEAFDLYRRAVEEDSLLAIAAARGAAAGAWEKREEAALLATQAVETSDPLPERYRFFTRGVEAYLGGRPDDALAYLDSALSRAPEWLEPVALMGEVHYHLFPTGGRGEVDATAAWASAARIDPTFLPPLPHQAEIAIRNGRMEEAAGLIRRMDEAGAGAADHTTRLELMLECATHGGLSGDTWAEAATSNPGVVLGAGHQLGVAGAQTACAAEAFHALLLQGGPATNSFWWSSMVGLQSVMLAEGKVSETVALLDSALALGYRDVYTLYLFNSPLSGAFDHGSREAESVAHRIYGERYRGLPAVNLWLLGIWLAGAGQSENAAALADELSSHLAGSSPSLRGLLPESLRAHMELAEGRDLEAISVLSSLVPEAPLWSMYWKLAEPLPLERIQLARALLRRGDARQAHEVAASFDHPAAITFAAYLGPSLAIRLQAAEEMNRTDLARGYRDRLARLGWEGAAVPLSLSGRHLLTFP